MVCILYNSSSHRSLTTFANNYHSKTRFSHHIALIDSYNFLVISSVITTIIIIIFIIINFQMNHLLCVKTILCTFIFLWERNDYPLIAATESLNRLFKMKQMVNSGADILISFYWLTALSSSEVSLSLLWD